jgi:hypothetical protein
MPGSKSDIKVGSVADIAFGSSGVADVTAPTVAEINALTRIECDIVGNEPVSTPRSGNVIDISSLCDRENYELPTTIVNGRIRIPFFRYLGDGVTDVAWDLFDDSANPPTEQHLAIARYGFAGATAAADDVIDLYTVMVIVRGEMDIAKENDQRGFVELSVLNRQPAEVIVA